MNFGNDVTEIQQKYERERKSGREKILNFGNHITEILLPKLADRVGVKCSKCASARRVPKGKLIVAIPFPK